MMSMSNSNRLVEVKKIGLRYNCPPSILVEFSRKLDKQYELSLVDSFQRNSDKTHINSTHHAVIELELNNDVEATCLIRFLQIKFPHFFGNESNIADDQIQRIVSKLLRNTKNIVTSDELFEKNRIHPSDNQYEYDKRRDFDMIGDECSWDCFC